MRTIKVNLYKFSELSEQAKERAIQDWRSEDTEYTWQEENKKSMQAFADLFPIKVKDWSYGGQGSFFSFYFYADDAIEELTGQRLATYIWNNYRSDIYSFKCYSICNGHKNAVGVNGKLRHSKIQMIGDGCSLTDYCMDYALTKPLFEFMKKPDSRNFKELLQDCFDEWIKACEEDIEVQNSDEYIKDTLEANDYEFTEDGERQ
jgi:hypothetical protein